MYFSCNKREDIDKVIEKVDKNSSEEGDKLDRVILIITSGAIIISLSIIPYFLNNGIKISYDLVVLSWLSSLISLGYYVFGFIHIKHSLRKEHILLQGLKDNSGKNTQKESNEFNNLTNKIASQVNLINYISITFSFLGVLFLALFVILNINKL